MIREWEDMTRHTDNFCDYISEYEDSFIETFCKGDVMHLYGIWYSPCSIKINYVLDCGQHISDSIPKDDFIDWCNVADYK